MSSPTSSTSCRARGQACRAGGSPPWAKGLLWCAAVIAALAVLPAAARTFDTVDAGDRYTTPAGLRVLYRMAGGVVVAVRNARDTDEVVAEITADGGALEGYEKVFQAAPGVVGLRAPEDVTARHRGEAAVLDADLAAARGHAQVAFCNPVFIDPPSGLWMVALQDIVLRLKPDIDPGDFFGRERDRARPLRGTADRFVLTTRATTAAELLAEVERYATDPAVAWAEPDFRAEIVPHYTPNDPMLSDQWHLENMGYNGQLRDADVDATNAWNTTRGTNQVVIAIIDNGVEFTHPDLSANIFTNTGDEVINGADDDGNGYVDDVHGWNFAATNNNPGPAVSGDNHGTPCAGVAAASGNNSLGVAGMAYRCRILPIKFWTEGLAYPPASEAAAAMYYTAGLMTNGMPSWRGADVFSMSFGTAESSSMSDALDDAATIGRMGKGCVLFASTGNSASGYAPSEDYEDFSLPAWGGQTCVVEFIYQKDSSVSAGDDAVWVAFVRLPDGSNSRECFDQPSWPTGWVASGDAVFRVEQDPAHAYGVSRYAVRSGNISDNEYSQLTSKPFVLAGGDFLALRAWVSCERTAPPKQGDWLVIKLRNMQTGAVYTNWMESGVPGNRTNKSGRVVVTAPGYPSSHSKVIALGASTDREYRSDYSQHGTNMDFVAPSGGGFKGIITTDRTGNDGDDPSDYHPDFGGTSSACPLAAGIGALVLSANTNMTRIQVREALRNTCQKIGGEGTYTNGFSVYYGYGRVNAWGALMDIREDRLFISPTVTTTAWYGAYNTLTARTSFGVSPPGNVTLRAGEKIELGVGFEAETGSVFSAEIEPEL